MLKSQHRLLHGILLSCDLAMVAVAVLVGSLLSNSERPYLTRWLDGPLWLQIAMLWVAWTFLANRLQLYRSRRTQDLVRESEALLESWLLTLGLGVLIAQITLGGITFAPLATLLTGLGLIIGSRYPIRIVLRSLRSRGRNFRRSLFVGMGESAKFLAEDLLSNPHYGTKISGSVRLPGESGTPHPEVGELGELSSLQDILRDNAIDLLIICPSEEARSGDVQRVFELCDRAGIQCHYAPPYFTLHHLHPQVAWYSNLPTIHLRSMPASPVKMAIKRLVDVSVATLGLAASAVVMAACAVAIKLQDGGPVIYRQRRVGRGGRDFHLYKLRTMCVTAEQMRPQLASLNQQDGPAFKIASDPRITPIGRILRKYSLDELPQLINILKGDMSLVGPRPPTPDEVKQYDWWQRRRLSVRPGLTCIWQVWGRNSVTFDRWVEMDLYYIDHWSLWMDLKLILRTVPVVARGTGM